MNNLFVVQLIRYINCFIFRNIIDITKPIQPEVKNPTHTCEFKQIYIYIWAASLEKVPNVLSHCHTKRRTGTFGMMGIFGMYQKKDGHFWYDTDLKKILKKKRKKSPKNLQKIFFSKNSKKSVSYQKNGRCGHMHPSFFWYDTDSGHWDPFAQYNPNFYRPI